MLLGNRKEQTHEQNWCVVLNTIDSEITKKKVARKMSEVFTLSGEEATDLVNNTPIILLDNLSRPVANKVKQFFSGVTRDMLLTNDVLRKRKYYRTVWPEEPNLSFLHSWEPSAKAQTSDEVLGADEALDEIRSLGKKKTTPLKKVSNAEMSVSKPLPPVSSKKGEIDKVREDFQEAQMTIENLRKEKEALEARLTEPQPTTPENGSDVEAKNQEIERLQALLQQSTDRYDVLKEEFRESRTLFEEKLAKNETVPSEVGNGKLQDLQQEMDALRRENETLRFGATQKAERFAELQKEVSTLREIQETQLKQGSADLEDWKLQIAQAAQKIKMLEKVNGDMEKAFEEKTSKADQWRAKYKIAQQELDEINDSYSDLVRFKNEAQQKQIEIETNHLHLTQSLDRYKTKAEQFESRCQSLEKEVGTLKQAYETQEKIVTTNLKHLDLKEEELVSLKEKYRKLEEEQKDREHAYRQNDLEKRLSEKESRLRDLIRLQQKMETQIRSQEDEMRKILKDQESLEKDILQGREEYQNLFGKSPEPSPES